MSAPIISVKNLGKKYNITHQQGGYVALRDVLTNVFKNPFSFVKHKAKQIAGLDAKEEFWALKDVNFTVEKGEAIGIIGANGAGKSTLLKILTGITPPTTGEAIMRGKVASLLEVGTGFHPELSGRENIFLNGAILGMTKKEINDKFNDIVKFSGVEKFLDTPVKYYSSGMSVRLAFAVAAHLEPDILIVDEVLAVGDAEFQKKCLGKMDEITKKDERTILFVSHNLEAVRQLCKRCILLKNGKITMIGETKDVINKYLLIEENNKLCKEWLNGGHEFDNEYFKPLKFFITQINNNRFINIEAEIKILDPLLTVGYAIYSEDGQLLYWTYQSDDVNNQKLKLSKGVCLLQSQLPIDILNNGNYRIELIGGLHFIKWLFEPKKNVPHIYLFVNKKLSNSVLWTNKRPGILAPVIHWDNLKI